MHECPGAPACMRCGCETRRLEGYVGLGNRALTCLQKANVGHGRFAFARRCYAVGAPGPNGSAPAAADLREPRSLPAHSGVSRAGRPCRMGTEVQDARIDYHFSMGQLSGERLGCHKLTGQC